MANKPLAKLKTEIGFNSDLTRLVDIMKGIAAAQYNVMERKRTKTKNYNDALEEIFGVYDFRRSHHPFVRARSEKKLVLLITTDGGFLGGLNMKVLNAGLPYKNSGAHFMVIGDRGVNFIKEMNVAYTAYPGIEPDNTRYDLVDRVTRDIFKFILKEKFGQLIVVAPYALSFTTQRIELLNFIPCPIFFKEKPKAVPLDEIQAKNIILESAPHGIIEYLTELWLRKKLIEVFELAKLAEYGARTMHLESSYQTLSKIDKKLKLEFFKIRREKIDQSLRESFTSQLICDDEE